MTARRTLFPWTHVRRFCRVVHSRAKELAVHTATRISQLKDKIAALEQQVLAVHEAVCREEQVGAPHRKRVVELKSEMEDARWEIRGPTHTLMHYAVRALTGAALLCFPLLRWRGS